VAEGFADDVDAAVKAAHAAFARGSKWRTMDASERGRLLYKLADLMERDAETLATLDSVDNGKPKHIALGVDTHLAIKCFRYYAGFADKVYGQTIPLDGPFLSYTRHEALGVVGQIVPWNFPLLMATWKLAPALAMGNVVVLKPAEQTPLSALYLASLFREAGFPAGVVNVVTGFGPTAGAPLVAHPLVSKIAFTGSTEVGRIIQREAAGLIKNVTLELGGKSPLIVCADANVDEAVDTAYNGLFFNSGCVVDLRQGQGQAAPARLMFSPCHHLRPSLHRLHSTPHSLPSPRCSQVCCASSRVYVHESIYDEFVAKSVARATARTLGDCFSGAEQGPQVDEAQFKIVMGYIEAGKAEGAKLMCGGAPHGDKGYFVKPTVFADVTDSMKIAREEIFGPVLSVLKWSDVEDVIARANDTIYGLAAAVLTKNLDLGITISNALRAGVCWVGCYNILECQVRTRAALCFVVRFSLELVPEIHTCFCLFVAACRRPSEATSRAAWAGSWAPTAWRSTRR